MECNSDKFSRLEQMVEPDSKWDLSPNDKAAISWATDLLKHFNPSLDWDNISIGREPCSSIKLVYELFGMLADASLDPLLLAALQMHERQIVRAIRMDIVNAERKMIQVCEALKPAKKSLLNLDTVNYDDKLSRISNAVDEFHGSLDRRENGNSAAWKLSQACEEILNKHWKGSGIANGATRDDEGKVA